MAGFRRPAGRLRRARESGLFRVAGLVALTAAISTACGGGSEHERTAGQDSASSGRASRANVRPGAMELVAYRTPDDFPLQFRAWIPAEAIVSAEGPDGGASLRIAMPTTDSLSAPYLNIYVFAEGTTKEQAEAQAEAEMTDLGVPVSRGESPSPRVEPEGRFDWALSRIPFTYRANDGRDHTATILTGRHDARVFNITLDGPLPRARWWPAMRTVLDSWRWSGGTPLVTPPGDAGVRRSPDSAAASPRPL